MTLTFILLTSFFIGSVLFRKITGIKLCAICSAVSGTWLVLLFLYFTKGNVDPLILGVLMGGSAVGVMYYLSSRVPEKYQLLKFPFLISAFWIVFRLIGGVDKNILMETMVVGGVWVVLGTILVLYNNNRFKEVGKRLIECCKNW